MVFLFFFSDTLFCTVSNNTLEVYPNPITKDGVLEFNTGKNNGTIFIYNNYGILKIKYILQISLDKISLKNLGLTEPGIYNVKLYYEKKKIAETNIYIIHKNK